VLSGGLTVHNLRDMDSFAPTTAKPVYKEFNDAIMAAVVIPEVCFLN
jgi:aromatic ring-opening dioxygenase catalytic subunit (LigB family)